MHIALTSILANSEDPDEMLHKAAFHQGLHCLQRSSKVRCRGLDAQARLYLCCLNVTKSGFLVHPFHTLHGPLR